MSVDKDNLIKDMFNLIGIAHAEAQAIRALDISSQLKKNFDNLSDENQEILDIETPFDMEKIMTQDGPWEKKC